MDTHQTIQDNFNVIQIPMSDDPDTNIKQVRRRIRIFFIGFFSLAFRSNQ